MLTQLLNFFLFLIVFLCPQVKVVDQVRCVAEVDDLAAGLWGYQVCCTTGEPALGEVTGQVSPHQ